MKKACVIGFPISHSRSPLIHNYWLKRLGIAGLYEKREVRPEQLAHFLSHLREEGYEGCNVTIPHKEAALRLIPNLDAVVRKTGSLNTVYFDGGKLSATSTDGEGFYQNLLSAYPRFDAKAQKAIILGAGGSARAIIERLLRAGMAEIAIVNRTVARAEELAGLFGPAVRSVDPDHFDSESKTATLLVNTTSQGMAGQPGPDVELSSLPSSAIVADIVYVPLKTELLRRAEARGLATLGGLGMLLHQAVVGFEKWFGQKPAVTEELYRLVARDVDPEFR
ncbi:MAG: shikimate dehydrogenase [Alphaproteobacteria bacterium]|nr:shikimate dehydrogenase [Alphaproteobacteria bacterium]